MGDGLVDAGTLPRLMESILGRFHRSHPGNSTATLIEVARLHRSPTTSDLLERCRTLSTGARDRYLVALHHGQAYWNMLGRKEVMWNDNWNSPALILCLGALTCFLATFGYTRLHNSRRGPYPEKHHLNGGSGIQGAGSDIDYDDTDYEDDSETEDTVTSSITQPLRRIFNLRGSSKRSGSRDVSARRNGSIVRISSSDPRSSLSVAPIHLDLDAKTMTNASEAGVDQSALSIIHHTASVARRRRESGRLLGGSSSSPARTSSPFQRSSSPLAVSGSPSRGVKNLRRNVSKTDNRGASSYTVVTSEGSEDDAESSYQDISLPSILKTKPEVYASVPKLDYSSSSIYSGAMWSGQGLIGGATNADSGASFFSHSNGSTGRLPPGAGYAPTSPLRHQASSHKLGTLTADQAQALWPEKRCRKIRLKEPDWAPFVEVHDRARERLEAAAHVAANTRSASPSSLVSPISSSSHPSWDDSTERISKDATIHQPDDEFWFERFTPSTAAAGRDWDWRKRRRARQQAQIAASAAAIEAIGGGPLGESRTNGTISDEKEAAMKAGNVGLTDVQLQAQSRENGHFSEEQRKPALSIATNANVSARGGLGRLGASMPSHQASSPIGKTLRLKRYSSTSSSEPRSSSPSTSNGANSSRFVNGATQRSGSKPRSDSTRRQVRRASESDSADPVVADGDPDENVNVPSRLSSLTPKLVKRPFVGKRERDAALTAQLLAEADEVSTDEDLEQSGKAEEQKRDAGIIRKSASSSMLQSRSAELETEPAEALPQGSADLWLASQGAWSSADAYGITPSPHQQQIGSGKRSSPLTDPVPVQSPSHYANNMTLPLLPHLANLQAEGGVELRRQGSAADSESSKGSGSQFLSGSDFSRPKAASRRGILSSASSAATSTDGALHNGAH